MGTDRRYADAIDRRMNERALQVVARGETLQTLTPMELQLDKVPITVDPAPRRRVRVWVRFGNVPVQVEAVAARWSPDAVGIVFHVREGEHRCWVWGGAAEEVTG